MLKRKGTILIYIGLLLLISSASWGASFPDISVQELKAKLDSKEKILVINPLSDIEFNENHIPGTVNIPLHLISTSDRLPAEKGIPIITYCLGPK